MNDAALLAAGDKEVAQNGRWVMKREKALAAANDVMDRLAPAVDRIRVAGSVRRGLDEVKDVELVYVPRLVAAQRTLFEMGMVPATEAKIYELMQLGVLRLDQQVLRNGPKYKRVIHVASGVVVELFLATPDNWGLILALRTGPAEFMKVLVSHEWQGGVMPVGMKMQGGYLWRDGQRLSTPTEESFFQEMGLQMWQPEWRTAGRLREFARSMLLVAGFE